MLASKLPFFRYGFLATLLLSLASTWGAPPKPETVNTHWPGITVTIYQIARLPGNRVSVKFLYEAASNAPGETCIADRPLKAFARASDDPNEPLVEYYPYSIENKGQLIDEATGKTFPPSKLKPGDAVHPGRTEAMEVIRPHDAFFLGGVFECPPVNQDDPPKIQHVTFNLPGLKKPITGIPLPREDNVPVDFFPKPHFPSSNPTPPPNG